MECWEESLKLLSIAEAAVEPNKLNGGSQGLGGHDSDDFIVRRRFSFDICFVLCRILLSDIRNKYSLSYVLFPLCAYTSDVIAISVINPNTNYVLHE